MCRCRPRAATPGRPLRGDEGEGPQTSELARDPRHDPVLREEVVAALAIAPGERHVDATFGAGGCTRALLAPGAEGLARDLDPDIERESDRESVGRSWSVSGGAVAFKTNE